MSPSANQPSDARGWIEKLSDAFERGVSPEPLKLAEQALRDQPTDPYLLHLAALAALVADRPNRCLRYLKRLGKRYELREEDHLLRALAMASQGLATPARQILERHGLDDLRFAARHFHGSGTLLPWMVSRWNQAFHPVSRRQSVRRKPPRAKAGQAARPAPGKPAPPSCPAEPLPKETGREETPELPRFAPHIPVQFEWANPEAIQFDGPGAVDGEPGRFRLRGDLARLALLQGFDELLCLSQLHGVETYWYQVETVRKVLKQFRGRVLLADEVGLGKTIEAGMILKEYLLRGMVERFLILTPASLVGQWREEIETKFGLSCATTYDALLRSDPEAFWSQPRVIASIATARRQEHFGWVTRQAYDLVVVDEAHHLKNRSTRNYKLVNTLQKRFLLLLSATPVQNSLVELYNLLTLLKPGIFQTEREFRAAYMTPGKPRVPENRDRMRDLMRDVMVRNTRALVDVRLPPRHALTLRVEAEPEELDCYGALSALVREVHQAAVGSHRLALRHLLKAAGSCPATAAATIERFAHRHSGDSRWDDLARRYRALATGSKAASLLELLGRNPEEKKMVFVHHRETLARLGELLEAEAIPFAVFDGGLTGPEKDAAIAAFRDRVPVLLCTQTGGEGRNVQFCNTLINFDLPWNPMAIEQRIGRLHRIGQHREVFIFNLVMPGTLEDEILRILDEKIHMFELVVGEVGAILGEIDEKQDFSELVFEAWVRANETDRSRALGELGERMVRAKEQYEGVKELDDHLFGEEFETA